MLQHIPPGTLLDRGILDDPYPFYQQLQQQAPVWRVPASTIVVVTSYALITEAVQRVADFSSHMTSLLYRDDAGNPASLSIGENRLQVLATADPPAHASHRAALAGSFSAKRLAQMEADIEAVAGHFVAKLVASGGGDFMAEIANPLPMTIVSQLVGFPQNDIDSLVQAAFDSTAIVGVTHSLEQIMALSTHALDRFSWVAEQCRKADPDGNTVISTLKRAVNNKQLSEDEATAILTMLLAAGGESTTSLLGNAVRILAEDQALQSRLRDEPALIATFLEEVLRLESPFRFHLRSAPADTRLGGVQIPAASSVLLFWAAANRDPARFENPGQLDLDRQQGHLTFGRGIHTCVGAPLARLEARIVLRQLLERCANIGLDPDDSPTWVESLQVRRYQQLAVRLRPA